MAQVNQPVQSSESSAITVDDEDDGAAEQKPLEIICRYQDCAINFPSEPERSIHERSIHNFKFRYHCREPNCNMSYANQHNMIWHTANTHTRIDFKYDEFPPIEKSENSMTGEKYMCPACRTRFVHLISVKQHLMRKHGTLIGTMRIHGEPVVHWKWQSGKGFTVLSEEDPEMDGTGMSL